jgi:hypothetical protein
MYHMTNGASATNDTTGTQAVTIGGDLSTVSSGGCMIDSQLDIFCGQSLPGENAVYDAMLFANWHGGVLPGANSAFSNAVGTNAGVVAWGYGCGVGTKCATNPTFEAVQDIVINSRINPTIVACPTGAGVNDATGSGIRLLNAANGSVITVSNSGGTVIQTLTNLDFGQVYTCAAWDNVGNLYGASTSRQVWRVWSPPGANTNTTVALAQTVITPAFTITGITDSPGGSVAISFTSPGSSPSSSFTLVGSSTLNGIFAPVVANITGGSGAYQAAFTNSSTAFYKIEKTGP